MNKNSDLVKKYNVAVPRYTSYPAVPNWNVACFSQLIYLQKLNESVLKSIGVSIYIHLPYCESLCTYCGCNTRITVNHSVELPYLNGILNEFKMYANHFHQKLKINELHLGGGTPTFFSATNLKMLIRQLKKIADFDELSELSFEGHPNNTTFEHLNHLANEGFKRVSFGIQDFDKRVQKAINRIQSYNKVNSVIDMSRQLNYNSINVDLVYGLPFQTKNSLIDTVEKTILLRPHRIAFYGYAHVPWVKPGQRKFSDSDVPTDDIKKQLFETGKMMFLAAGYIQIGLDHFALPNDDLFLAMQNKKLNRNFMGYTTNTNDVLIGLGCSAIGSCKGGFVQNVKSVEAYLQKIEEGVFPFLKGHILEGDDEISSNIISSIMCNMQCEWNKIREFLKLFPLRFQKLCELEKDGMVERKEDKLIVTPIGKPFLRNIASVFDKYYSENLVSLFSTSV